MPRSDWEDYHLCILFVFAFFSYLFYIKRETIKLR